MLPLYRGAHGGEEGGLPGPGKEVQTAASRPERWSTLSRRLTVAGNQMTIDAIPGHRTAALLERSRMRRCYYSGRIHWLYRACSEVPETQASGGAGPGT
eukprot:2644154-Rhodomonas_salina.2